MSFDFARSISPITSITIRRIELLRRAVALLAGRSRAASVACQRALAEPAVSRGAVTVDHYLGSFSRSTVDLGQNRLRRSIANSGPTSIARSRWRNDASRRIRKDPQAHYDLGAAVGLQASYVATVEGKMLAGFRAARRCYDEHEKVLSLDPSTRRGALIVGTYRYVVSTLSLPMRMLAYVAGFRRRARSRHPDARETAELDPMREPAATRRTATDVETTPAPMRSSPLFWCTTGSTGTTTRCRCFRNCGACSRVTGCCCSKRARPRSGRACAAGRRSADRRPGDALRRISGRGCRVRKRCGVTSAVRREPRSDRTEAALADLQCRERRRCAGVGSRPRAGGARPSGVETRRSRGAAQSRPARLRRCASAATIRSA